MGTAARIEEAVAALKSLRDLTRPQVPEKAGLPSASVPSNGRPTATRLREWGGLFDEKHSLRRDPAAKPSAKMTSIRQLETGRSPTS